MASSCSSRYRKLNRVVLSGTRAGEGLQDAVVVDRDDVTVRADRRQFAAAAVFREQCGFPANLDFTSPPACPAAADAGPEGLARLEAEAGGGEESVDVLATRGQ
jgi:hypothetical protein